MIVSLSILAASLVDTISLLQASDERSGDLALQQEASSQASACMDRLSRVLIALKVRLILKSSFTPETSVINCTFFGFSTSVERVSTDRPLRPLANGTLLRDGLSTAVDVLHQGEHRTESRGWKSAFTAPGSGHLKVKRTENVWRCADDHSASPKWPRRLRECR